MYYNVDIDPPLEDIESDIASSTMSNKNVQWTRWDEDISKVQIVFDTTLSQDDIDKLDTIMASYQT